MGVFDRAGNLLKGFLRKPLQALERSPEERRLERELEESAALERARANIEELDRRAGTSTPSRGGSESGRPESQKPAPVEAPVEGRTKRRMGPDD